MSDVTNILQAIESGDPSAAADLLPLVYDELRNLAAAKIAQEKPCHTLQATALVHEAYVRLVDGDESQYWNSRGHFFAAAAEAMRRILIEGARRKQAEKRGGQWQRVSLDHAATIAAVPVEELLALDDALERLNQHDPLAAQLVKLRYYAGLSLDEAAPILALSTATAYRHWAFARAWLHSQLGEGADGSSG